MEAKSGYESVFEGGLYNAELAKRMKTDCKRNWRLREMKTGKGISAVKCISKT